MSSYRSPVTDLRFALNDVLGAQALFAQLGYAEVTDDVIDAVLEEGGRFADTVLAPLNAIGDEVGCRHDPATGNSPELHVVKGRCRNGLTDRSASWRPAAKGRNRS